MNGSAVSPSLRDLLARLLPPAPPSRSRLRRWWPTAGTLHEFTDSGVLSHPSLRAPISGLRSFGQVLLLNNPLSGVVLLLALTIQSPSIGLFAVVGTAAARLGGSWLGGDAGALANGLYGFNGALVGCAVGVFAAAASGPGPALVWLVAVILGALASAWLLHGPGRWWHRLSGLPPLTLPFCLVTWALFALARAWPAGMPLAPAVSVAVDPGLVGALLVSLPRGFGQVFLCDGIRSGLLVLVAAALASPLAALIGLAGGCLAALSALACGIPTTAIGQGLASYNGVLVAIAVGGTFHAPNRRSLGLAMAAAALSGPLTFWLAAWLPPRWPVLTLPFVLVTMVSLVIARRWMPALIPVGLHTVITPEEHWRRFRVARQLLAPFRSALAKDSRGCRNRIPSPPFCWPLKRASTGSIPTAMAGSALRNSAEARLCRHHRRRR
jgi:urea transporter